MSGMTGGTASTVSRSARSGEPEQADCNPEFPHGTPGCAGPGRSRLSCALPFAGEGSWWFNESDWVRGLDAPHPSVRVEASRRPLQRMGQKA